MALDGMPSGTHEGMDAPPERGVYEWGDAGPTKIRRLRREAVALGLDGNRWFAGVDTFARAKIGLETVNYVTRVNKYFVAYRLAPQMSVGKAIALLKEPPPPPPPALPPERARFEVRKLRVNFE